MPFLDRMTVGLSGARVQQAMAARDAAKFGIDEFRPSSRTMAADAMNMSEGRTCGAENCASWTMPWKNRRRPMFEQEWGCSNRCMQAIVRAAVRRELTEGGADESVPHRHRVPLGLVLLAQGWITHPQLQAALELQRVNGEGRIGDWLMQSGLDEERVTRGLGVQWNCPVLSTEGFRGASMALVMPKRLVAEFGMLPLRVAGSSILYLAFEDRMDAGAAMGIAHMSGLKVECGLLRKNQFAEARAKLLELDGVAATMFSVPDADVLAQKMAKVIETAQPLASRLVRVHQYYWLRVWLESGAMSGVGNLPTTGEDVQDYLFTIGGTDLRLKT
jgi:hypothetical protein